MNIAVLADDATAERIARLVQGEASLLWVASSLAEAAALARARRPDVLLASAPRLRGAGAALRALGVPVVVLRSGGSDASLVYEAMSAGAVYALALPADLGDDQRTAALRSLRLAASSAGSLPPPPQAPASRSPSLAPAAEPAPAIVALGASTGGPPALAEVLRGLSGTRAAVLIVQHLDPLFIPDLAGWLGQQSGIPVDLSSATLQLRPGRALLAATDEHLVVAPGGALRHAAPSPSDLHHPSVDRLFASLAAHAPAGAAALLTGMGRDGAQGLLSLRRAGWLTLAQDAASSVVYGMPKAAHEAGAASVLLPPDQIGARLRKALGGPP